MALIIRGVSPESKQSEIDSLAARVKNVETQNLNLGRKVDRLEGQVSNLQKENNQLRTENDGLRRENDGLRKNVNTLRSELSAERSRGAAESNWTAIERGIGLAKDVKELFELFGG